MYQVTPNVKIIRFSHIYIYTHTIKLYVILQTKTKKSRNIM